MPVKTHADLSPMAQAYIAAAIWTEEEMLKEDPRFDDGANFGESAYQEAQKICDEFEAANAELLEQAGSDEQNGHDLWLTRNGHGAGFWDRGYLPEIGKALTDAAHALGAESIFIGDDGELHFGQ